MMVLEPGSHDPTGEALIDLGWGRGRRFWDLEFIGNMIEYHADIL